MNQLILRSISGVVFIALIIGSILWSAYAFYAVMLVVTVISMLEFFRLSVFQGMKPQRCLPILIGVGMLTTATLAAQEVIGNIYPIVCLMFIFLILIVELYRKADTPIYNIGVSVLSVIYVAVPLSLLSYFGSGILLGFFIIVWSNDVGAYLVGRAFGRRKLFERISPKKSWEGFVGGIIFAVGIGVLYGYLTDLTTTATWVAIGIISSLAGVAGDLVESMFKRSADVKDSGNVMPGHGGLLDRFDALLLATPMVWIYLVTVLNF